ncbi:MAG TPA: hypothetical protein PK668_12285 [Myxococcota bacterium]|nr:hypothetical protein [Myxococcota bacterium]HRY93753.1 hypothetical protein [Myxococcota bacterium]HSA22231.1 hypothetical protein [Myxococcota bacterium]
MSAHAHALEQAGRPARPLAVVAPPPFTLDIDGCIVRGYLSNRRAMLRELAGQGYSRSAVLHRARELGLSAQFVKWCAIGKPDVALRACLGCGTPFVSVGVHNRLCPRCRHKEA